MNTRPFFLLSRILFFIGVAAGFALSVIAIWDNLESTDYYFTGAHYAPFKGLQCPLIIAPSEQGIITAIFKNPTGETDTFYYRAQISGAAFSTREIENQVAVPPHQARTIQFTVDRNDVDLLFFILFKITILPNAVRPAQEAACGVIVAHILGLTGSQVTWATLVLSLLGIVGGLVLWKQTAIRGKRDIPPIVQILGLVVIFTLLATYMGWWTLATILAVLTILLGVISMRFAFS